LEFGFSRPRFIADVMLGRLARWLRVLGYDTLYFSDMDDASLARRARAEDRILLTRDVELARRRGLRVLLLADDRVEAQLREVVRALHLSAEEAFSRCLNCNAPLVELDRAQARDRVPPYVFATQTRFRRCPECSQIYWRGTHWAQMRAVLESADWSTENGLPPLDKR
jgi:uncharacterized protein